LKKVKTSPDWLAKAPGWETREVARHLDPDTAKLSSEFIAENIDFEKAIKRRRAGEPLEYILGHCHIDDLIIKTDSRALIPRPETETLVRFFAGRISNLPSGPLIDCGTGSGFIAAWLAKHTPRDIIATEIDSSALDLARENFHLNNCSVWFLQTDRLSGLSVKTAGIVANLPYVSPGDPDLAEEVEKYEPARALYAGEPLLDFYRDFLKQSHRVLKQNGELWLEVTPDLAKKIKAAADKSSNWSKSKTHPDTHNRYRFLQLIK
jgi:release factor glutamine methyltransferase